MLVAGGQVYILNSSEHFLLKQIAQSLRRTQHGVCRDDSQQALKAYRSRDGL